MRLVKRDGTCKTVTMQTLNAYIDRCKTATKSKSDNQLAMRSGLSRQKICEWRKGGYLPSDEGILKLARAARLDEKEALVLLNIWRANDESRAAYESIYALLKKTSLAILISLTLCFSSENAHAMQVSTEHTVYYEKWWVIIPLTYGATIPRYNRYETERNILFSTLSR